MGRISRSLVVTLGLCVVLVAALALGVVLLIGPGRSTAPARVAPSAEVAATQAGDDASSVAGDQGDRSDDPSAWLDAPVPTTTEGPRAHPPTKAAPGSDPSVSTEARPRRERAGGGRAPVAGRPTPAPTRSDPAVPAPPSPRASSSPRPTPGPKPTASPRPTSSPRPAPSPTCRPRGQGQDPKHPLPRCPKG